jgi:[glutamine synthetase] adenylyltransferase / [glutamine synthetase]-adenylyl-L-tyrosine phosphorylase
VKKGAPVILSDPDRVLVRLDSFISAYGARSTLYELWTQNPAVFELLLMLFDRSEFLAETAIRTPDLVDELEMSGRLRKSKNAAEILRDLRYGLDDEDQRLWIRRYHQTEQMRIGLRDILELADFTQGPAEISALADACLQYALEVVMRKHKLKKPPFCVIGLGKLGGQEIDYGSDLDIIFVTDAPDKKLPELQRLALDLMDLVSGQSELGVAFETDARLRPDGEKGLIVNNFSAYEDYYRKRASLWEIQTITRVRPVAGDLEIGGRFQQLAGALANFSPENVAAGFVIRFATGKAKTQSGLAAYAPDWKRRIARMRERIEKERTPAGKDDLAIKTGSGGLIDAEFMAQAFCLANGWQEPNTARALERARQSGALDAEDGQLLSDSYRALHRIECILRRWSFEGEVLLPDDPAPMYRVAVRCGFPDAQSFLEHVGAIRRAIRSVYLKVFFT